MRIAKPEHPIVSGLTNFNTTDELWYKPYVHPDATIIAESYSRHTGNWEPTALVSQYGQGRCFCLLLGHDAEKMQSDGFKQLFVSGIKWTANLK